MVNSDQQMNGEDESQELYGVKKFVNEYNSSFKPMSVLQEQANVVIEAHKRKQLLQKIESKRKQKEPDEEGWVTVSKQDKHAFRARKAVPGGITKKSRSQKSAANKRPPIKLV